MVGGFSLRKILFKGGGFARAPKDIAPGMRFKERGSLGSIWVVTRLVKPFASAIPHAVIAPEGAEGEARIISTIALKDSAFYKYLPPEAPVAGGAPPKA